MKPDLLLQTALASGSATSGFPWLVLDCNGACHHHNTHDNDDNVGYALLFLVKITIVMISDKPKSLQKVSLSIKANGLIKLILHLLPPALKNI